LENVKKANKLYLSQTKKITITGKIIPRIETEQVIEKIKNLKNKNRYIAGIAVSADGTKLVSGSSDKTVRLRDTNDSSTLAIAQCNNTVLSVAISPDSRRIVSLDSANVIQVWDID
jgi:WD40 repeat protein